MPFKLTFWGIIIFKGAGGTTGFVESSLLLLQDKAKNVIPTMKYLIMIEFLVKVKLADLFANKINTVI